MGGKVAIFGAGGHGRDTLEVFLACNRERASTWELAGFLSEVESEHGRTVGDLPVLGGWEWLETHRDVQVVCAIGDPAARRRITERAEGLGAVFATVVHPTAVMPERVLLGRGVIVSAGVLATNDIRIGDHAILNLGVTLAHDVRIGGLCTLAPGVHVSGRVQIGEGCEIGTGAAILPRITIGRWAVVGAGAAVTRDLPANITAVGVPARVVKSRPEGWHLH